MKDYLDLKNVYSSRQSSSKTSFSITFSFEEYRTLHFKMKPTKSQKLHKTRV